MPQTKFVNLTSLIIAFGSFVISFTLFFYETQEILGSGMAALMVAGLCGATFIVLRWLLLANRN